jgi:hypothetical protein
MINPEILATTLKHLNQRRHNFYRSIEENPDDPQHEHWNQEVVRLNEAIRFFEDMREKLRLNPPPPTTTTHRNRSTE